MRHSSSGPRHNLRSFSILELLLVLALAAALMAISMAGYSALVQASAITTGAQMISDEFAEARSDAVAQNTPVEVRIYAVPTPSLPTTPNYTLLQLHWLKSNTNTPPARLPLILPPEVVIDSTPTHSPLISTKPPAPIIDPTDSRLNSDTRAFHYLPDGSTDLNSATNWFLTVRPATQSDPAHFPSNWACVQVDPTTGRTRIYRP